MVEDKYTIDDVYQVAGNKITDILRAIVEDEERIVDWFYEPNDYFNKKSPCEICEEGNQSKLESALMDIVTGAHGG